jgi:hypothetical protein
MQRQGSKWLLPGQDCAGFGFGLYAPSDADIHAKRHPHGFAKGNSITYYTYAHASA